MWASTHIFGAYDISYYVQMPLINFHADMSSEASRGLCFGLSLYQNLYMYSKTSVKWPLSKRQKTGFQRPIIA